MGVIVRQKIKGKGQPWWVFINHQGKRKSIRVGTKAAANKVASDIEARLQLGKFNLSPKPSIPLFKHFAQGWLETTVAATCKESTANDYGKILENHVEPFFGDMKLDEITTGAVKDFISAKVNEGLASSTINHYKNVVSGILNDAVDDELIKVNPALNLGKRFMSQVENSIAAKKVANGDESDGKADPLSGKELKLLLSMVQQHYTDHYPLFLFMARTGTRIGEALGLRWGDIDFNSRFISIKRSLSRGKITTLKNSRERRVDMSRQLTETLKAHRTHCKKKGLELGLGDEPQYVFTNTKGGNIDVNNWRRRVYNKALKKAELRKIRIHDLRHTYATLRISKGDNINDVSKQLGHFSTKFTLDVYSHWMPGKKKSEVDALDDIEYQPIAKVVGQ